MKEIMIIFLLIISLSLGNATELGKAIHFDMNKNTEFDFIFDQDGNLFIQVDFPKSDLLTLNIQTYPDVFSESIVISPPGKANIVTFKKGYSIKVKLSYKKSSNETGIIWMFPSIFDLKVDLNQKYEWKYDYKVTRSHITMYPLIYSIENAEKDAILEIKFNDKLQIDGNYKAPNPLKIFNENYYRVGVTTYKINKGESYKILVSIPYWKIDQRTFIHFLPSYSFDFKEKEPEKEQLFEFGKQIPFDMNNNNEFEFVFDHDGSLFIQVDFPKNDLLTLNIQSYDNSVSESYVVNSPGKTTVIPYKKGYSVKIKLSYKTSSNEKGIIWMNPSTKEIKVDLNQKYEWKYDYKMTRSHNIISNLTFSIDNAEKDAILEFKFNENLHISDNYIALNPLRIFHKNFYMPNITNFKIEKGESYKIKASIPYWYINQKSYIHFLPKFSLNFIEKAKENESVFEFGNGMPFNIYKNREFYFTFTEDGTLFVQIEFPKSNLLTFSFQSYDNSIIGSYDIINPGKTTLIPFMKGFPVIIKLSYKRSSNEKGIIWINPSIKEIKIDLKQKYEWKFDYKETLGHTKINPLIYSIDNAEKDAILEFKFNDKLKIDEYKKAPNPLKILHNNYYRLSINSYEINKGESYIFLFSIPYYHSSTSKYIHFLPSYSFHFIIKEEEKEPEREQKKEPEKETEKEIEENEEENEEEIEEEEPVKKEEKEPVKKEEKKEEPAKKEEQEKKNFLGLGNLSNLAIICIIIISILIIGIIIFLICRKNKSSYKGKKNKKFIELEVTKQKEAQE